MAQLVRCHKCLRQSGKDITPFLSSPTDSGYGSFESSPEASPQLSSRELPFFDGSGSREDSVSSIDETELDTPCSKARPRTRSMSTPCRLPGDDETSSFAKILFEHRSSSPNSPSKRQLCQTQLSDRYVPRRDPASSPAEKYRTAKQAQDLTPSERILRNNNASSDPFAVRAVATTAPIRRPLPHSDGRYFNLGLSG